MRLLAHVLCAWLLIGVPPSLRAAHADDDTAMAASARRYLDAGLRLYEDGAYDQAIVQFRLGLAIEPHRDLHFALAQAERQRGDCDRALRHYRAALARTDLPAQQEAIRIQIERCEASLAANRVPPPRASVATTNGADRERPGPGWTHDWVGHALLGTGLVAGGFGTYLVLSARDDFADKDRTYAGLERARAAETRTRIGWGVAGAGAALVVGAVIQYALAGPSERFAVAVHELDGGAGLTLALDL